MDYSDNLLKTIASVHFYLREGYYGTALKICSGVEAGTPHIQLLKGIALNLSDRQSLLEIETAIASLRDAPAIAQYSAAEALFFMKEYAKAKPFLEKIVKENPDNALFACLSGWTEISLGRDQKSTVEMFERALEGRYMDGYVGKMTVLAARQLANDMKALAKDALAVSFGHMPFHVESARACLLAKEWNNTLQALQNSNIVEAS
ncbi:tetratricopeptide repeat protein [Ancylostoma caninum]|uniref:Tetratricopeptide repeat protein n=1 Tax=Ancylostoma caninum TaxID=29170 RepID=A0A368H7J8_ANCCA|nr:tetratricopeptide repeat protein [Ancylostoma caninum]